VAEMLAEMKAKLDASRSLLYECARYVDLYKAWEDIARERTLTPEERAEMKRYTKLSDALTPMAKGMGSEYCNQNAYDCIQIHGGSGFMKDYACERVYRDARITSIYEGTTQLQVVAAIRHVTGGTYKTLIEQYAAAGYPEPVLAPLAETLKELTALYDEAVATVTAAGDAKYLDFMARRLVEMAGVIVMSYLLLQDAKVSESFNNSAIVYVKLAQAEVNRHIEFIRNFKIEQLAAYGC
ncbi:MAG: acyl-CoA dehydrogenase, partial [Muribaculaceae bacterium]|nr:acyl-CoA dehydrogenase [Muribaculaceae bacterium]